jgi:hypothetical protein
MMSRLTCGDCWKPIPNGKPPIKCTPWCEDGDGHTSADRPDDQ